MADPSRLQRESAMKDRRTVYNEARLACEASLKEAIRRGWKGFAGMTADDSERGARDPRVQHAEALYRQALEMTRREPAWRDLGIALYQLGMLQHFCGKFDLAEQSLKEGLAILESLPQPSNDDIKAISGCCYHLGILAARRGSRDEGRTLLKRSQALDAAMLDVAGQSMDREALAVLLGE
jgi:tetratricopeptide (TPR) repeat protein